MKYLFIVVSIGLCFFIACTGSNYQNDNTTTLETHAYPHSKGFDLENSDAKAIMIADNVMKAMGGYKNWKATRYLHWNFFGSRTLLWDKWTGEVRVESKRDSTIILVNIHTLKGQAMKNGVVVTHPDSLKPLLQKGKEAWINDSYWLVMPFKLKDSGVTLTYHGTDTTEQGIEADILRLTFKGVGVTPENAYHIFVEKSTNLVKQWAFYINATDEKPRFITPWEDYKQHGEIILSGNRGKGQLTDIQVLETVPKGTFSSFEELNLEGE